MGAEVIRKLVERSLILGENETILFVRRALDDPHMPGAWEFPGGKVDPGESLEAARYRETLEETSLGTVAIGNGLVHVQEDHIVHHHGYNAHYILRTSVCRQVDGLLLLSSEHESAVYLTPNQAFGLELTPQCSIALRGLGSLLPQLRERTPS